ncbi:hypothetical protein PHISP_07510 [Aspergillus sp. HF37]|nr:hypothetical protein PHISP_07510 [Aspergillus sp. HF37]
MRSFNLFAVLSYSVLAVAFTCPKEDIMRTKCMGPKDCLYPNPDNCETFIHCEVNADGVSGRPTVKKCPADLLWNDEKKWCDWPRYSTCPPCSAE